MNWDHLDDPRHWRERADEARYAAEHMTDEISKDLVFKVAAAYERVAERAEERMTTIYAQSN